MGLAAKAFLVAILLGRSSHKWPSGVLFYGGPPGELRLVCPLRILCRKALSALFEPRKATCGMGKTGGELIATPLRAEKLVFLGVGGCGLGEHGIHLLTDGLEAAVGPKRGVRFHLGPIKCDQPEAEESGDSREAQDLDEAGSESLFIHLTTSGDGGVVRGGVGGDHSEGDVLLATPLDPSRPSNFLVVGHIVGRSKMISNDAAMPGGAAVSGFRSPK